MKNRIFIIFLSSLILLSLMGSLLAQTKTTSGKNKAEDIVNKGIELYKDGDIEGAIGKFKEAIKIDSNYAFASYAIARCYTDQDKTEMALEFYEKALEIYTSNDDTSNLNVAYLYCDLGLCYRILGKSDKAIEFYQKSIKEDDKDPITYNNLAAVYYSKGDYNKAIENASKALELDTDGGIKPHAYYWIGMSYKEQEKYKEAIENLELYLKASPDAQDEADIKSYIKDMQKKIK